MFEKCWYETAENKLIIWEGVCAFWHPLDKNVTLVKLGRSNEATFLSFGLWNRKITSEGYWMCAELCGCYADGTRFFYHSKSPTEAIHLLTEVSLRLGSELQDLTIRIDPDPFRRDNKQWIEDRLNVWQSLTSSFPLTDFKLVLDSNMPL
ncbi:unnamed protein product [Enterobius vermicularis]|uniref:DUF4268 domain-containing protein n=1 Tax=Enterobius vermicularis TaxID=51028 RepID=A0A0N4UZJ1_ENTVE|nr:unnamed protein product [Enterobius vermicularis]